MERAGDGLIPDDSLIERSGRLVIRGGPPVTNADVPALPPG